MNRSDSRACLAAIACIATVPVAAFFSATAKADPVDNYTIVEAHVVCNALTDSPSLSTVSNLFRAIVTDTGFSVEETARVVVSSVAIYCPENQYVLDRFVAVYGGQQSGATSVIKPPIAAGPGGLFKS